MGLFNMKKQIIGVLLAFIILNGCGSNIDTVKKSTLKIDETITVGDAIDNYKMCSAVSWREFETDNGRQIVEASCDIKQSYKEQAEKRYRLSLQSAKDAKDEMLQHDQKYLDERISNYQKEFEKEKEIYSFENAKKKIQNNIDYHKKYIEQEKEEAKLQDQRCEKQSDIKRCKETNQWILNKRIEDSIKIVNYDYSEEFEKLKKQSEEDIRKKKEYFENIIEEQKANFNKNRERFAKQKQERIDEVEQNLKSFLDSYRETTKIELIFQFAINKQNDKFQLKYLGIHKQYIDKEAEETALNPQLILMTIYNNSELSVP
ncbi:hypothetical protein [Campylobacter showae]|uniref:hypothetical protein n=1 Tax=Campylobacter showae TaxID=204 RepID=UPI003C6F2AE9